MSEQKQFRLSVMSLWVDAKKDIDSLITVDTQAPAKTSKEGDWIVVSLADLRPNESIDVSVMSEFIDLTIFRDTEPSGISVKSEENLAQYTGPSEITDIIYRFGFWMFIILMVLIFIAAIYQQHFMDPRRREEMILKEIDKLPKDRRG